MKQIKGIHHVTAIASDPKKNLDFYSGMLGLRLVKLTVNFDDPGNYHLYYGDYSGQPGTILTFFPWRGIPKGRPGAGQMTVTSFSVPRGSFDYWKQRLHSHGVAASGPERRLDEDALSFRDYDGMQLELLAGLTDDGRSGWVGGPIPDHAAIRGFYSASLATGRYGETARLLTDTMGFRKTAHDGHRHRFEVAQGGPNAIVDLIETPGAQHGFQRGIQGAGSVHHIAYRVADDPEQAAWRAELVNKGFGVSPVMDRKYFHSIYYREPSGILFEIATDTPGFTLDEPLESLGRKLVLPEWLEPNRQELMGILPELDIPELQHA